MSESQSTNLIWEKVLGPALVEIQSDAQLI